MYLRKPVRERFLNMGKERRWFNKRSLCSKIEEVKKVVKSEGTSSSILTNSKTVFTNFEDKIIDNDESNTSFDIIDNGSDNGDEDEVDDDDFDFGAVAEDPIGSFSDLNPDSFDEINHGTNLDISKQKENSLSNKTDLLNGKIVEHSNESEISEEYQAEVFSSHSKRENSSSGDNGHTGSSDDDEEDDTNDNKSYAHKDLQCSSVEGETHSAKSDSESDSSVELTRPRFRRVHKRNFIEVISISDSPLQSSEASCIAQSSSHNTIVIEDSSISADSLIKTNEVSSVEKSYSLSNSEEYFDNSNGNSKGDDDASINDECFDNSYEIQQEPDCVTPLLVNSCEMDGDGESNLSRELTSVKSRNDHYNNNFKDVIISSPINPNKMSSVAESCSYEGYYVNNGHVHNDQEYDDDDDCDDEDEDVMSSDAEQEPDHITPLLVNSNERAGENESDLSAELTRHKPSKVIEDIDITDSAVKIKEETPSKELGFLSNNEEYCDNGDGNNEHYDTDNDDDDANEDVRNKGTEQDPHHLASFLVKSSEIDGDSGSGVSTDLIHPPESRSDHSRSNYKNTCNVIEDVSVSASPVKTAEVSAVEESYSHSNSKRCSDDDDDNSAGHDGIDRDYTEDDVIGNIEDNEEESVDLVNSHEINSDDDSNLSSESTRPKSSMNNNKSVGIEDASFPDSPLKSSLSARLFKKYNPEKSESGVDDFELFLQKIRTPRLSKLSDERTEREASINEFIVDDDNDDDDQEEDVFYDPGFTPELEEISDDDNRNDDIEIATPASTYYTPLNFKTPKSTSSSTSFKSASSRVLLSNHSSRPKSILDNILAPYSTEKEFKKSKDKLVKDLFELYNQTVFDNQMPSDFQITWNPRMRSTAGFCYYSKKNGVRMARIELADKVIDCADRLRDTLIHEMCHAAAWLISGVKAGHGTVWKKWTLRANSVHQDLPPISRCHSYTINAKYTYRCTNNNCSNSFGRHSKSVNLEKSRCAYCHSRLELVPQLKKDGTPQTRTPSKFALFVKQNYARIKSDHDRFSHQDVMKALSSEFAKVSTS